MTRLTTHSEEIDTLAAQWIARRDAGLSPTEAAQFVRWREQDVRHAEALHRFESTWSALARPRQVGAAAGLRGKLDVLATRQRLRKFRGVGAAAITALALLFFVGRKPENGEFSPSPTPSLVVQRPESRTLPDGSTVELKTDAKILVDFSGKHRRVQLVAGEALFAVAKDPARTFVVEAGGVEVRALGTAFAVQLRPTGIEVLVTEGRVAVNQSEPNASPAASGQTSAVEPRILAVVDAGSRVVVDSAPQASLPQVIPIVPEELVERLAWRATRVEFSGTPLSEVVVFLNRHHATRFVIEDESVARVQLSGNFRVDDAAVFTRMLEAGFGLKAEPRGEKEIVLRRAR